MPQTYPEQFIDKRQNVIVRSSNRFTIVMGNVAIGLLQDLRCQDDYSPEPASGIGDIHVKEYVPTIARYTISSSQACMFTGALRRIGISFEDGNDAMRGMVFDIDVYDRILNSSVQEESSTEVLMYAEGSISGSLLRRYTKCSFASGDIEIRKHALIVNSATINACLAVVPQSATTPNNGPRPRSYL